MRWCFWLATIWALAVAAPAVAGAWLRETGETFVAVTTTARSVDPPLPSETETALYVEHGLRPRLTFGADINERLGLSGHALVFLRRPLGATDRRGRWALQLGAGGHHQGGNWAPMLKTTLAYGYGIETARGAGWLSVEAAAELRRGLHGPILKLDTTLGLPLRPWLNAVMQLETARGAQGEFGYAVTPGLLVGSGPSRWHIGVEHRQADRRTLGIKLSIWRRF